MIKKKVCKSNNEVSFVIGFFLDINIPLTYYGKYKSNNLLITY